MSLAQKLLNSEADHTDLFKWTLDETSCLAIHAARATADIDVYTIRMDQG